MSLITLILSFAFFAAHGAYDVEFTQRLVDPYDEEAEQDVASGLSIWSPKAAENFTTLVLFGGGLNWLENFGQPGFGPSRWSDIYAGTRRPKRYDDTMSRIAAEGVIVIMLTDPSGIFAVDGSGGHTTHLANMMTQFILPSAGLLVEFLEEQGVQARPDFSRLALGGHASGTSVAVRALRDYGCLGVGGLVLLNPKDVSNSDPELGDGNEVPVRPFWDPVVTPGEKLNFRTPTLLLSGGLDGAKFLGGANYGPWIDGKFAGCTNPRDGISGDMGSDRFYDALIGPTWSVNATEFGFNDLTSRKIDWACPSYHPDPLPEQGLGGLVVLPETEKYFHPFVASTVVSFLRGVMDGDGASLDELEGAESANGVDTERKFELAGLSRSNISASCVRV